MIDFWSIPRCWPGECVAILAGGKSLTPEAVEHVRGRCRVIAINRAFELAPWADWLYGCDSDRFWRWYPEARDFAGTKIVVRPVNCGPARWRELEELVTAGVKIIRHSARDLPCMVRHEGASGDPAVVRGNNSLFQLLSVIEHTGAATVLLLGADMHKGHWHSGYGEIGEPDYAGSVIPRFETLVKPLAAAGVTVLNCSPGSALPFWPHVVELRDVI